MRFFFVLTWFVIVSFSFSSSVPLVVSLAHRTPLLLLLVASSSSSSFFSSITPSSSPSVESSLLMPFFLNIPVMVLFVAALPILSFLAPSFFVSRLSSLSNSASSSISSTIPKAARCRFNRLFLRSSRRVRDFSASNLSSSMDFMGAKPESMRICDLICIIVLRFGFCLVMVVDDEESSTTCSPFLIRSKRLVDVGSCCCCCCSSVFPSSCFD